MSEINNGDNKKWGSDLPLPNYVNAPSEIKPVYQLRYGTGDVEVTEEQYFRESYMRGTPRRMLYPASAYEALKKENAEHKATISNLSKAYERESNDCLKALEERDYWYDKADSLADKISKVFDVPVGEHSNVNCPIVESMKILCGEYVTKFDKQIEALKAENEAQAKRIAELEEDLQFVERWANHHGTKPNVTAQEALSCIQHYPSIAEITKSYKDGVIPSTRNPYAEIEALRKQLKRDEILRETQTNEGSCSVAFDQYPNCICPKNGDSK